MAGRIVHSEFGSAGGAGTRLGALSPEATTTVWPWAANCSNTTDSLCDLGRRIVRLATTQAGTHHTRRVGVGDGNQVGGECRSVIRDNGGAKGHGRHLLDVESRLAYLGGRPAAIDDHLPDRVGEAVALLERLDLMRRVRLLFGEGDRLAVAETPLVIEGGEPCRAGRWPSSV